MSRERNGKREGGKGVERTIMAHVIDVKAKMFIFSQKPLAYSLSRLLQFLNRESSGSRHQSRS